MGVLQQLGQLSWKTLILRRREPHILLIEILWPLAIFAVVAVVRYGTPSEKQNTCSYAERAMPSAGMLPFVQTTVCNLQNPCEQESVIQSRQTSAAKLSSLLSDLGPYLSADTSIKALETIGTTVKVAKGLSLYFNNTSDKNGTMIFDGIEEAFTVRKLLKDPGKVKRFLVEDMKIMTPEVAEAFLNASIDVVHVLDTLDHIDFRNIICNADVLEKYMFFAQGVDVSLVSKELCDINNDKISAITDMVQSQLDVGAIIRAAKSLTALTQTYGLSDGLEDIASMADILSGTSTIGSMFSSLSMLDNLPSLLAKLPGWIDTMSNLKTFESSSIDGLLTFLDPIIKGIAPNLTIWTDIMKGVDELKAIGDAVGSGDNVNWTSVLSKGAGLLDMLGTNETDFSSLIEAGKILGDMQSAISGNDMSQESVQRSLNYIHGPLEALIDADITNQIFGVAATAMDMMKITTQYAEDVKGKVDTTLTDLVIQIDNMAASSELDSQLNVNETLSLFSAMLSPELFKVILEDPINYTIVCRRVVREHMNDVDPILVTKVMDVVCLDTFADVYTGLRDAMNVTIIEKEMSDAFKTLKDVMDGLFTGSVMPPGDLYVMAVNLTTRLSNLGEERIILPWAETGYRLKYLTFDIEDWEHLQEKLESLIMDISGPDMMTMIGPMMETSPMWNIMGPMVHTMDSYMESMSPQMDFMTKISDPSTDMGKFMKYMMDYYPELMTAMMNINQSEMINMMMDSQDPVVLICDKHLLRMLDWPAHVPVADMETAFCNINWTEIASSMMSSYDQEPTLRKIAEYFNPNSTTGSQTGVDWNKMMSNMNTVRRLMKGENPIADMIMKVNFTRLQAAIESALSTMNAWSNMDMEKGFRDTIMTLERLDEALGNASMWRVAKQYMRTWNAYTKIMIKYMNSTQGAEVNVWDILANASTTLREFVNKTGSTMPELLEALKNTSSNPNKFMIKLMSLDLSKLCNGSNTLLSDLLGVGDSAKADVYEQHLCSLNWTVVWEEVMTHDPLIQAYINELGVLSGDWDTLPTAMLNWTEVASNTLTFIEIITKMDTMPQVNFDGLLGNFDMGQVNMTWESLMSAISGMGNIDPNGAIEQADMMRMLLETLLKGMDINANDTNVLKEMKIVEALYTNQVHAIMQFLNIHLTYFNNTDSVNLRSYLGSAEINKLLDNLAIAPELSSVGLQTLSAMLIDTNMANYLMSNMNHFCTNLTVFGKVVTVPAGSTSSLGELQSKLCALDVNITKLFNELEQSLDGLSEVVTLLTTLPSGLVAVNYSTINADNELFSNLMKSLSMNQPTVSLGISDDWMNFTLYTKHWETFLKDLSTSFVMNNLAQLQGKSLESAFAGLESIPEMQSMLQIMSHYVKAIKDRLEQSIAGSEDPLATLKGFPTLQEAMTLVDDLPNLYSVWVFNALYESQKMSSVLMVTSWDQFCNLTDLPVDVPGTSFKMATFHTELCGLNLTALEIEWTEYSLNMMMNNSVNVSGTVVNVTQLADQISEMTTLLMTAGNDTASKEMVLPNFLNWTVWEQVHSHLFTVITEPDRLMSLATSSMNGFAFLDSIASAYDLQDQMRTTAMVFELMGVIMDKLDTLSNKTVLNFNELLANDTETLQLWSVLKSPEVLEILMSSAINNKEFMQMLMSNNMTAAFMTVCDPASNFTFLTVPDHVSMSRLRQLQTDFCDVKLDVLQQELMDELMPIVEKYMDNSTVVDWSAVTNQYLRLLNWTQSWSANPPILDLPSEWLDSTYWSNILAANNNTENLWKLLDVFSNINKMLKDTNEWQVLIDMLNTGQLIADTMEKLLAEMEIQNGEVNIGSMFKNSTVAESFLAGIDGLDQQLIEGLISGLLKPSKVNGLLELVGNTTRLTAMFCDEVMMREYFTFPPSLNLTAILSAMCGSNDLMADLVVQLKLQPLLEKLSTMPPANQSRFDLKIFMATIERISSKMMTVMNATSLGYSGLNTDDLMALLNATALMSIVDSQLSTLSDSLMDPNMISSVIQPLIEMMGNSSSAALVFNLFAAWTKAFNAKLDVNGNKPLNLTTLLGDSGVGTSIATILGKPQWMDELAGVKVNPTKLLDVLNQANTTDVLCSDEFYQIFTIADNATILRNLQKTLCEANITSDILDPLSVVLLDRITAQQLLDLLEEMGTSHAALNTTSAVEGLMGMITTLSKLLDGSVDASLLFNATSFQSALTSLQRMMEQQLGQTLVQWAPAFGMILGPISDPAMEKGAATINVIVKMINSRLVHLTGTVSLETLLRNNAEITKILQAIVNITQHGSDLMSPDPPINFEGILTLIENTTKLTSMCDSSTLAAFLSPTGTATDLTRNLQTIICTSPDVFMQTVQNEAETDYLMEELLRIWNSSEPLNMNWMDLNKNVENMTQLFMKLFDQAPPMLDGSGLLDLFNNFNISLQSLEKLFQDPMKLLQISADTNPMMTMEVDPALGPFMHVWQKIYTDMQNLVTSAQGGKASDDSLLMNLFNSMSTLETKFGPMNAAYYTLMFKEIGQHADVQAFVCDKTAMSPHLPQGIPNAIHMALCGKPSDTWYDRLVGAYGPSTTGPADFYNVLKTNFKHHVTLITWGDFFAQIQNLTEVMSSMNTNETERFMEILLASMSDLNKASVMDWMGMLGDYNFSDAQRFLNFLLEVNKYLERELLLLEGQGAGIPMTVLLPNSTLLAQLLDQMNTKSAAALLTALIDPGMFLELTFTDRWTEVVCNKTLFDEAFEFMNGTDTVKIQNDLCQDAQSQDSVVTNILEKLQMADVLNAFNDWLLGRTVVTMNTTYILEAIRHNSEVFIKNLEKIQNHSLSMDGFEKWIEPLMAALESMRNPNPETLTQTCDKVLSYVDKTDFYTSTLKPILVVVINNMATVKTHMAIQSIVEDSLCDLANWNLTALTARILEGNLTQLIIDLGTPNMDVSGDVQCSQVTAAYEDTMSLWNKTITQLMATNTTVPKECLLGALEAPLRLLKDASQTLSLITSVMEILQDPTVKSVINTQDLLPMLDFIYNFYSTQQNASVTLAEMLSDGDKFVDYLTTVLNIPPEIVSQILNATIKADQLSFLNKSSSEIAEILCDQSKLSDVLAFPGLPNITTIMNISGLLCGPDAQKTAEVLKSVLDFTTLSYMLSDSVNDNSRWSMFVAHLVDVINNVQQLTTLPNFDTINLDSLKTFLPLIQRLLYDSGPEALARSINVLIGDLQKMSNDAVSSEMISDMQYIINGLTSLKVIRNFFPANIVLENVMIDPESFKQFLTSDLGLSPEVANAVLTSTIRYSVLLGYEREAIKDQMCNVTLLSEILNVTTPGVQLAQISSTLCNLTDRQITNLTAMLIQNLDVGDLVKLYVTAGVESVLETFNVTAAEAKISLRNLNAANKDLQAAASLYTNASGDLNLIALPSADALTGSVFSLPSMATILCGKSEGSLIFTDSTGASTKVISTDTLSAKQQNEMKELQGAFCEDLYKEIILSNNGPIIWTYLKPLLRGKILYSPNTQTTQELAEMMYNSSFKVLEDVVRYAKVWEQGLSRISELKSDGNLKAQLESLTSSSLVQSLVQSIAGISMNEMISGLDTLNQFDQDQIDSMVNLARLLYDYTSCLETKRFEGYSTEADVVKAAFDYGKTNNLLAVVVFDNLETTNRKKRSTGSALPKHVSYKIRMDLENVRNTVRLKERMWRPYPEDDLVFDMRYTRGFMQLQDIVETAIIRMQTGQSPDDPVINLKQFPTPCYANDVYMNTLSMYLLPIMMTLAWVASIAIATKNLVYDRQNGQEETLKVMGLNGFLTWWVWFITTMLIMCLTALVCIVILKAGNLYHYTHFGVLFIYIVIFCFSTIMMCYMVSAVFTQVTLAVISVLMVYFVSYLPYIVLISMEVQMKFWQKILACLSSTSSFGFAAQYLARYEIQLLGMDWDSIYGSPIPGDEMSFAWTCLMMIIDGFIYLFIGWYLRNVRPGKYGVAQPWYFPVCPEYWGCMSGSSTDNKYKTRSQDGLVESMPEDMKVGISVRDLTKNYGKLEAVKGISADFYEGQVTVLLGHNGAAKTTSIRMMTGILKPSSGQINIYGKPIGKTSKKIGICAQHNALFHYMTVEEHMKFYGNIKSSLSSQDLKYEIDGLLKDVDLWNVRDVRVSELSGGMRRRLCSALAFVGGSEVVILDEPTSGVDPNGRHSIWNLISRRKNGCTILLSTHHLDEADMVGDRIAIMHNGYLMCDGSPIYLKQRLGSGYHLKLVQLDGCNPENVLACLRANIPETTVAEEIGSELTIKLPIQLGCMDQLRKCLQKLDRHRDDLCIGNYGIFDTTMEEVFLKVCDLADRNITLNEETVQKTSEMMVISKEASAAKDKDWQITPAPKSTAHGNHSRKRVSVGDQKLQQFSALLIKRFHHYRRNWRMFLSVVVCPLLFVAAALACMLIKPGEVEAPSLLLSPALYGPGSYAFFRDAVNSPKSRKLTQHLWADPGMGTSCMAGMNLGSPFVCGNAQTAFSSAMSSQQTFDSAQCGCTDYSYSCNSAAQAITVPQIITNTTDILQDVGTYDVTNYLLKTYEKHMENRFGGFSFDSPTDGSTNMKATVWFNNKGHHALPAFYNALSNSILRSKITQGDPAEYGITVYNQPILLNRQQLNKESILQNAADIGIAMVFLLAFTAIPVGFMTYLVREYRSKEKQLHYVSGVGNSIYWTTSLLWDMFIFCITVGLSVVVMALFRQNSYWARDNLAGVVVLLLLYGWATITWMYNTVKIFKDSTTAYMILFCVNLFLGIILVSIVFILNFFSYVEEIKDAYEIARYVLLIFPPYSLCNGLIQLTTNQIQSEILERFGQDTYISPFSFDMLAYNYMVMAIEGVVFFVLVFITEIRCPSRGRVNNGSDDDIEESMEVRNEKQRVLSHQARDDALVVSSLSKAYRRGRKSFLAVNHLSFGVHKGECFGLLGVNGAGKTTTFRMLTGDLLPSEGSATVNHRRVTRGNPSIGQEIGYCPQENSLDGYLTARELLYFHAKLRGVSVDCRAEVVEDLVTRLGIDFADRTVHTYSGGMMRKVSIAIALLGDPQVVFLDEPTTGMDPVAKRLVWNCLLTSVKNNQSVILTSHSMEECDAMCTRLAIMVNGEFRCLGSPQLLKDKYGDGYTVTIYTTGLSTVKMTLSTFTQSTFPGAIIRDQHHGILQIDIPQSNLSVADIIQRLEEAREDFNILHYSVSQTTLDNVFMSFARDQNDGLVPEFADRYSGSGSNDSDSVATRDPFVNPGFYSQYGYPNIGYTGSIEEGLNTNKPMGMVMPPAAIYGHVTKL